MAGKNGSQIGAENVESLTRYLERVGAAVPRRPNGDADMSAIGEAAGLTSRQALYKNPVCKALIAEHLERNGLPGISQRTPTHVVTSGTADEDKRALERRCAELEKRNFGLMAEVAELRSRIRRQGSMDMHLAATGRIIR
jgi:hypothetical protein